GARQIITLDIDLVQTSCGYAVPIMTYEEERTILREWSRKQGKKKIEKYWQENNTTSLDGDATHIFED
ncbi:MAG: pyridoxamine 5'-phosphate oxidase family protein, partial [Aureispira sp.]